MAGFEPGKELIRPRVLHKILVWQIFQNTLGGLEGAVVCVGQDHFGNRYFEDLDTDAAHCRRWVEYSNYHMNFGWGTDRVPPKWNGWLSGTYDDVPTVKLFATKILGRFCFCGASLYKGMGDSSNWNS